MAEIKNPIIPISKSMEKAVPTAVSLGVSNLAKYQHNSIANQMLKASTSFALDVAKTKEREKANNIMNNLSQAMIDYSNTYEQDKAKLQDAGHREVMLEAFNNTISQYEDEIINSGLSSQYIDKMTRELETTAGTKIFSLESNFNNIENKQAIDRNEIQIQDINNVILTKNPTTDLELINAQVDRRNETIREMKNFGWSDEQIDQRLIKETVNTNLGLFDKEVNQVITDPNISIDETTYVYGGKEFKKPGKKQLLENLQSQLDSPEYKEQLLETLSASDADRALIHSYVENNITDIKDNMNQTIGKYQKDILNQEYREEQAQKEIDQRKARQIESMKNDIDSNLRSGQYAIAIQTIENDPTMDNYKILSDNNVVKKYWGQDLGEIVAKGGFIDSYTEKEMRDISTSLKVVKETGLDYAGALTDIFNQEYKKVGEYDTALTNMKRQLVTTGRIYDGEIKLLEEGEFTGDAEKYNRLINNSVASESVRRSIDWNQISDSTRELSSGLKKQYDVLDNDQKILFDRVITGKYKMGEFEDYVDARGFTTDGIRVLYNKSAQGKQIIDEAMAVVQNMKLQKYDRVRADTNNFIKSIEDVVIEKEIRVPTQETGELITKTFKTETKKKDIEKDIEWGRDW